MSNLLIEEPPLQVLPSLALAVGLNEAIILQQMHYWLKIKQQASDKYADSFRDGRWWVYNSVAEWQAQFPFWSTDTIQRGITSLRKQGVLTVAQLSHDSRDRTNWYAIDYDKMEALAVPVFNERQSKTPRRGNALPQDAAMGKTQPATVHDRKMRQCLTETSSENTKRIHQRVAVAAAPDSSLSLVEEIRQTKEDLSTLTPEAYAALEAEAREVVIATTQDPVRMLARQGKANTTVLCMMRKLKAEAAGKGGTE